MVNALKVRCALKQRPVGAARQTPCLVAGANVADDFVNEPELVNRGWGNHEGVEISEPHATVYRITGTVGFHPMEKIRPIA